MASVVSSKGTQGFTIVLASTDTPIQTFQTLQSQTQNATEVNGVTISPVPVGKKLIVTSITMTSDNTPQGAVYNGIASGSNVGATQLYQATSASFNTGLHQSVFWEIPAGNYLVVEEAGSGGQVQMFLTGVLTDA
ncbi:MAG: hypothetical protein P8L91_02825 [Candidatus Marinimicrobia bacterium]|nr:hypothetical protein [Candidatus Neomarinimicrobiota bacterium]